MKQGRPAAKRTRRGVNGKETKMEKKKYEVTLSVRMHGVFVVEAESEQEAEDIIGNKFMEDKIKIADLEVADDERIDCVGETEADEIDFPAEAEDADGEDDDEENEVEEGHFCPLHQCTCDEECSDSEKANCEYYQGLCDGRAEGR